MPAKAAIQKKSVAKKVAPAKPGSATATATSTSTSTATATATGTAPAASLASVLSDAAACLAQQDHGSALRLYRQAVAMAPDNAGAAMGLVMVLNHTGSGAEALQWLERLQASVGKLRTKESQHLRAAVWAQVGVARQILGQIKPAVDAFEKAAKLFPTPDLQRRIKQLRPLANSPEPVQQLILHARQLTEQGQLDGAVKAYSAALQLHSNSTEALHGLAMLQRQQGQLATALPLLQKAIVLAPDRADYFNDLGMIFQDRGELAQAVSFHKRALKLEPGFAWASINLGVAHKRLGQNDEALAAYQAVLSTQPAIPEVHNNLGNLLRTMGRHAEARACLLQALTLRPSYADALANLHELDAELARAKPVASKTIATKQASTRASAKKSTKLSVAAQSAKKK